MRRTRNPFTSLAGAPSLGHLERLRVERLFGTRQHLQYFALYQESASARLIRQAGNVLLQTTRHESRQNLASEFLDQFAVADAHIAKCIARDGKGLETPIGDRQILLMHGLRSRVRQSRNRKDDVEAWARGVDPGLG